MRSWTPSGGTRLSSKSFFIAYLRSYTKYITNVHQKIFQELWKLESCRQEASSSQVDAQAAESCILSRVGTLGDFDRLDERIDDGVFRRQFTAHLRGFRGSNINLFTYRIFKTLFADKITAKVVFCGGTDENPKRRVTISNIYAVVAEVGKYWCRLHNLDPVIVPKAFQGAFKKAFDRFRRRDYLIPKRFRDNENNRQDDNDPGPTTSTPFCSQMDNFTPNFSSKL